MVKHQYSSVGNNSLLSITVLFPTSHIEHVAPHSETEGRNEAHSFAKRAPLLLTLRKLQVGFAALRALSCLKMNGYQARKAWQDQTKNIYFVDLIDQMFWIKRPNLLVATTKCLILLLNVRI